MLTSLVAAYVLIAANLLLDGFQRRGQAARSLSRGPSDRGTSVLLGLSHFLALVGGPLLALLAVGRLPASAAWVGVGLAALGSGFRSWSMRVLGAFYTRTLRTQPEQEVVQRGPYRWIRHPGYLGSLLLWGGAGLASGSALAAAAILLLMGAAYTRRIYAEEAMLVEVLGAPYRAYRERTWRLLPFLF